MVGLTLAIGDFMGLLLASAAWVAAGYAAKLAAAGGMLGGAAMLVRRVRRRAH